MLDGWVVDWSERIGDNPKVENFDYLAFDASDSSYADWDWHDKVGVEKPVDQDHISVVDIVWMTYISVDNMGLKVGLWMGSDLVGVGDMVGVGCGWGGFGG